MWQAAPHGLREVLGLSALGRRPVMMVIYKPENRNLLGAPLLHTTFDYFSGYRARGGETQSRLERADAHQPAESAEDFENGVTKLCVPTKHSVPRRCLQGADSETCPATQTSKKREGSQMHPLEKSDG